VTFLSIGDLKQQISGAIVISGKKLMMLSLSMSEHTAKGLVSLITGLNQEDLGEEDFIDGVAELVNIVAGKIKAKLNAAGEHYETMLPFTILGDNHHIIHKNKVAALFRLYYTEKIGILARVFYI
jgi:chemotaxis protein CheX